MDISPPPPNRLTLRTFVPPGGRLEPVTALDTWATVATRAGMNKWQLIYYNYPTLPLLDMQLAAREVNWYLKNYVGCTVSRDGGRNYAFSAGLKVWVPAVPPPSPDAIAKQKVLAVLADPIMNRMLFSMGLYFWITPGDFQGVARAVKNGKIQVKANLTMTSNAQYHYGSNTIEFNPNTASDSLIVHECVHAIVDIKKLSLTVARNEGAAYVAQHLYELLKTGRIQPTVVSWTGHLDWLSPIAWQGLFDEAGRLAQLANTATLLPDSELEGLFAWINGTNFYRGIGKLVQTFDGI